jgi:hypothetical protein
MPPGIFARGVVKMVRMYAVAAAAALIAGSIQPAEAGSRFWFNFFEPSYDTYYAGPEFIPEPDYEYVPRQRHRVVEDPYLYEPDPYYNDYEPVYRPHRKRTLSSAERKARIRHDLALTAAKPVPVRYRAAVAAPPAKKTQVASVAPLKKPSANSITCGKAASIVADYGFSNIKTADCEGKDYAFNATRGGAPYLIRMSAATGELTEVKKLQ